MKEKIILFGIILILVIICIYLVYKKRKENFQQTTTASGAVNRNSPQDFVQLLFNNNNQENLSLEIPVIEFNHYNPISFEYIMNKVIETHCLSSDDFTSCSTSPNLNLIKYNKLLKYLFNEIPPTTTPSPTDRAHVILFQHHNYTGDSRLYNITRGEGENITEFNPPTNDTNRVSSFKIAPRTRFTYSFNNNGRGIRGSIVNNSYTDVKNVNLGSNEFPRSHNDEIHWIRVEEYEEPIKTKGEFKDALKNLHRNGQFKINSIYIPNNYIVEVRYNSDNLKYLSNVPSNFIEDFAYKHLRLINLNDPVFSKHNFIFKFELDGSNRNLFVFMPVCEFNLSGGGLNHLFSKFNLNTSFNNYRLTRIRTDTSNNNKYIFNIAGTNYKLNTTNSSNHIKTIEQIRNSNIECKNIEDSVILFYDNDFRGQATVLKPGNYNQSDITNNEYSSININGVDLKCKIYQNNNFGGESIELNNNVSNLSTLSNTPNFNNQISSVKVYFNNEENTYFDYLIKQLDWSPYINNPYLWSLKCKKYKNLIKIDYLDILNNSNTANNSSVNIQYINNRNSYLRYENYKRRCPMIEEVLAIRQSNRDSVFGSNAETGCGMDMSSTNADLILGTWVPEGENFEISIIRNNVDLNVTGYRATHNGGTSVSWNHVNIDYESSNNYLSKFFSSSNSSTDSLTAKLIRNTNGQFNKILFENGGEWNRQSSPKQINTSERSDFKGLFNHNNVVPEKWNKKTDDEIVDLIEDYFNNDDSYTNYKSVNLGCYRDSEARDLQHKKNDSSNSTITQTCRDQCKNNYDLMGIQFNSQCFCDDSRRYNYYKDMNTGDNNQCSHNENGDYNSYDGNVNVIYRNRIFYQNQYLENIINTIKQFRLMYRIHKGKNNFLTIGTNNTPSQNFPINLRSVYKTIRFFGPNLLTIQVEDETTNNLQFRLHNQIRNKVLLWNNTQITVYDTNTENKINESGTWTNIIVPANTTIINYNQVNNPNNSNKLFFGKPPTTNIFRRGKHNNLSLKAIRIINSNISEDQHRNTRDKLCPTECMGTNISNDKESKYQNNYFTAKNTSVKVDNQNPITISGNQSYGICGDYLNNNNCSTTKENNSIDCRTCNIPVIDKNNADNNKFCPNICYNNIYGNESNIMENDGTVEVCNKYLSLEEDDMDDNMYFCHTGSSGSNIAVDCTNCKIMGNENDERNKTLMTSGFINTAPNFKNFMSNPDTFINTDNKERFQTSNNILGIIISGGSSSGSSGSSGSSDRSIDYILENQISSDNLYIPNLNSLQSSATDNNAILNNINKIRNISRNKLFGIYSNNLTHTLNRTTYPYNLPEFINDKPNVILGPGDKLEINNNTASIRSNDINSRTLTTEKDSNNQQFHTNFTPDSNGNNIRKIKIINMPDNCKLYNLDENNCRNQYDENANNCRFIDKDKLSGTSLKSNNLTSLEKSLNYDPLNEELKLYKTLEKDNAGNTYKNVNELLSRNTSGNNFCFSVDLENTNNAVPFSGICTNMSNGNAVYPCVNINTKNINNRNTSFIRHRDAVINELGMEIRQFVLHNPGTIQQNINTLNRIFDVNSEIQTEIEADQLIERQLLSSNQNELNNIRNNLMREMQKNVALEKDLRSNVEGFTNRRNKSIKRISSNYNNENLTVMKNPDDSYGIKINENCLSVYGDDDYKEIKCNDSSTSQKFYEYKVINDVDSKVIMGKLPLPTTKNNYPYSVFKSGVTNNCLQNNDEGVSIEPCNPNSENQKWAPFTDPYKCLDSR